MPIYEFECRACGKEFEKFYKKITNVRFIKCPECNGPARKVMSSTGQFLIRGFRASNGYSPEGYTNDQIERAKGHNSELYKSNPEKFATKPSYVAEKEAKETI
jgi:putative FmdB family regulatory protein